MLENNIKKNEYKYKAFIFILIFIPLILPRNDTIELLKIRPEDLSLILAVIYVTIRIFEGKNYADKITLKWTLISIIGVLSGLLSFNLHLSDISIYLFYIKFISPLAIYIIIKKNGFLIRSEIYSYLLLIIVIIIYEYYRLLFVKTGALYGSSPNGYEDSPLATGFYYILCQIIIFYVTKSINKNKNLKIIILIINALILPLIIMTGSKASIIVSIIIFISIIAYNSKIKKLRNILFLFFIVIILMPHIIIYLNMDKAKIIGASIGRLIAFNNPLEVILGRGNWFKIDWIGGSEVLNGAGYIIGHITEKLNISFGMHYDNSILFAYLTGGILTILLIFEFIYCVAKKMIKNKKYMDFIILISFGVSGLGGEILNLSLSAFCFFYFLGITMITMKKDKSFQII